MDVNKLVATLLPRLVEELKSATRDDNISTNSGSQAPSKESDLSDHDPSDCDSGDGHSEHSIPSPTAEAQSSKSQQPLAMGDKSGDHQPREYTVADYLSKEKKWTPAKKEFRHILKIAAVEAKAWGTRQTYSSLTASQKKHIQDRVIEHCPALKGHVREIDNALAKSLLENKYYLDRKARKASASVSQEHKKRASPKKQSAAKPTKESSRVSTKQVKNPTKSKSKHHNVDKRLELKNLARRKFNSALMSSVKDDHEKTSVMPFVPCDQVVIEHKGDYIGYGVFIKKEDSMYSLIGFMDFIPDNALSDEEICLPRVVPADKETGKQEKTLFSELEEDDLFLWKTSRLAKKTEEAVDNTKRLRKPNSKYS